MNKPNYTQTPNVFYDEIMADLGYAEIKCMLYIFRRTFGFHKQSDKISLTQFETGIENLDRGTGLKRPNIIKALKSLTEKGLVKINKGKINSYSLLLEDTLLVTQDNQTSNVELPEVVTQSNTQKKEKESIQKKDSEQVAYNQKEYIDTMRKSEKPIDKIIGIYLMNQDINLPTKSIAQATYVRHLRGAKQLLPWTETEVTKKMLMKAFTDVKLDSDKNNYTFTLETVYKFLTK